MGASCCWLNRTSNAMLRIVPAESFSNPPLSQPLFSREKYLLSIPSLFKGGLGRVLSFLKRQYRANIERVAAFITANITTGWINRINVYKGVIALVVVHI